MGLFFSSLSCIPIAILWMYTSSVLRAMGIEENLCELAGTFSAASVSWLWPLTVFQSLTAYLQAQGNVVPALVVNLAFMVVNIGLNVLLVHGGHGWNAMGFIGSPVATTISRFGMAIVLVGLVIQQGWHKETWKGWTWDALEPRKVRAYLEQALPLTVAECLEDFQLQLIAIFAGRLGAVPIATHSAVFSVFFLFASFQYGAMTATSIRVGHHIGAAMVRPAKDVSRLGFIVALATGLIVGLFLLSFRQYVGRVFSDDPNVWEEVFPHMDIALS
jgi:multidrug resistance protein, MATE family